MTTARSARVIPRDALRKGVKPRPKKPASAEQRQLEEIDHLIKRLPTFRPLAKLLRDCGVDPTGPDARRLSSYALAHFVVGLTELLRGKPVELSRWTEAHDLELRLEVGRLRLEEGLSERKAVEKIAATQRFPYTPRAGRRYPNSDPKKQKAAALRKRWTDYRKRQRLLEEEACKLGAVGIWGLAIGIPAGEILRIFGPSK